VVAHGLVEREGIGIVGADLDADHAQPGRHGADLEPGEHVPTQSAAAVGALHAEQGQVGRGVAIVHDPGREQAAARMDHRDVRRAAPERGQDPVGRIGPAQPVFDGVARQLGDGAGIAGRG
jgi:hypothetical protein